MRWLLPWAIGLLACTAGLELDGPSRADRSNPDQGPRDAGAKEGPADVAPPPPKREDASPPAADAAAPDPCQDGDGDGYGVGCAAGPDCDDADPEVAPGAVERCDGRDNDCDGAVDERWPAAGRLCTGGQGTCARPGMWRCAPDGLNLFCDFAQGSPQPEICNGLDDDCDGEADEGVADCCLPGQARPCGLDQGRCEPGTQRCDEDLRWTPCDGVPPAPETCDGVDEDCDGQVDEGVSNPCGACGPVPDERCDRVDNDCDGQIDEGVANACGACGPLPRERCDGVDNDCDGQVDEGVTNPCGACGPPPSETCDGADEDCDGRVDEGVCAPAVDACAAPAALAFGVPVEGPIGGALALHTASCGAGARGPETAFTLSLPPDQAACLTTAGSDFDTVLHVRADCADPASATACNDDAVGLQSRLELPPGPARTWSVFVDSYRPQLPAGVYRLQATLGPCEAP